MARQVPFWAEKKYMRKNLKTLKSIISLFTILYIFSIFGCSPKIEMAPEELNDVVINSPGTEIVVDPENRIILDISEEGEQPRISGISAFPFCHCRLVRECHDGRSCVASYCDNCKGIDPEVAAKIVCI